MHLSRVIAAALLSLSWSRVALAEVPSFGLQVGASISNLSGESGFTADSVTGFAGGVRVEVPIGPAFSIQPEMLFVQRGAILAGAGGTNVEVKYNSLEIPVFAKLSLPTPMVSPNIFAGPLFSFSLSRSLAVGSGGTLGGISFNPRTFDFGVAFGGGAEFGPIFVNLRYEVGFVEIDESTASWQSRGFLALVGLKL